MSLIVQTLDLYLLFAFSDPVYAEFRLYAVLRGVNNFQFLVARD
jgi:hypothetical protein